AFFQSTQVINALPEPFAPPLSGGAPGPVLIPAGDPSISGYNGLTPKITNGTFLAAGPVFTHQIVIVICDGTDEILDSGLFVSSIAGCNGDCETVRFCGNGTVDPGEICDDGNNVDDDGC